jgi:hypothetical protein
MKQDKDLAIIAPYFGTLPSHFQLWLNSCAANPEVTWFLFTDDHRPWKYPSNVNVIYCTLTDLKKRFSDRLGFPVSLDSIKKLGDYKPLYGFLFEDILQTYKAWAYVDVGDVIYGSFDRFAISSRIQHFDRLGCVGHLTICRNEDYINRRFMLKAQSQPDYHAIFSSPRFKNFEETATGSIDQIWQEHHWITGSLDDCVADLSAFSYKFRISVAYEIGGVTEDNKDLIFEWANGHLFSHEIGKEGGIITREFLYVHFKRRPMYLHGDINPHHYIIAPDGFYPAPQKIDKPYLMKMGASRFPDPIWIASKRRNLQARWNKMTQKLSK